MGQSCFSTSSVSGKNTSDKSHSETFSKNKAKSALKSLKFSEITNLSTTTRKSTGSDSPIRTQINKVPEQYLPERGGCDPNDNHCISDTSQVSQFLIHREFMSFPGLFQDSTAALSLKSCEKANMPHHLIVGGEDGSLVLIDYESGDITREFSQAHQRDVNSLTNPISSGLFASSSRDKMVKVWNLKNEHPLCELEGHTVSVTSVTMNLDGTFLVSGSRDNTVRLWDIERAEELECCDMKQNIVHFVQWVPQLHCVAQGGEDLTLRLWDVRMSSTGKKALGLSLGSTLTSMDYHPTCCELPENNMEYMLLTGHNGFNGHGAYIAEWDLRMPKRLRTFYAHKGTVRSIRNCISSDSLSSQRFVSAGDDGAMAFFSTEVTEDKTEVIIDPKNIHKLTEARVTSLDACTNGDIFASTWDGAVVVFRPTPQKSDIVVPVQRYRFFGTQGKPPKMTE
ncbi:WD repeat domain 31 [Trypanosoma theileri]|uniref:WD repeat domain 31 n=1 Tax=Trypanosoma theileri TaxID=67003 RepID=A0A1X0NYQ0_9TRYP|nr:WD repeat domain 31 [Trypanosoma theileri]ORC89339.1 WD repeat domain 31 [Trypanosoma theileri]